jgi:hypothetical protein
LTKGEQAKEIDEAIAWMRDGVDPGGDGTRFLGWKWDMKAVQTLFEASLMAYPGLQLLRALADFQIHWIPRGPAPAKTWIRRWPSWLKQGVKIGDPMVVGA